MKSLVLNATFVSLLTTLMLLSSAVWASPGNTDYRLSAETWAENYFEFFSKHHLKTGSELQVPQVWLFSPKGDMVRITSKATDPQLEKFAAAFPDSVGTDPLPGQPTSAQARAFLAQALSDQSVPAPKKGRWYAVLILKDRPSVQGHGCNYCAAYDKQVRDIQMKNPGILETVRVTIVLSH